MEEEMKTASTFLKFKKCASSPENVARIQDLINELETLFIFVFIVACFIFFYPSMLNYVFNYKHSGFISNQNLFIVMR